MRFLFASVTSVFGICLWAAYLAISIISFRFDLGFLFGAQPSMLVSFIGGLFLGGLNIPIAVLLFILSLAGVHGHS